MTHPKATFSRRQLLVCGLLAGPALALPGCTPPPPVKVGFLGGLTGPTADIGVGGRDGAQLALDHDNARTGAAIELVAFDDRQRPNELASLMPAIQAAGLIGMVGPMTSSVAAQWIPLANAAGLLTLSPTVASTDFSGLDDHFFRICSTTQEYAYLSAEYHVRVRGWKRLAILRDDSNAAYSRSWAQHYRRRAQELGAQVMPEEAYRLTVPNDDLAPHIDRVLALGPDALVLITPAFDAARIAQRLRAQGHPLPLAAAEWAATGHLLELGGQAVEGMVVAQFYDRNNRSHAYLSFREAFVSRYRRRPGFSEVAAYDAMNVMLAAHRARTANESLSATLLRLRRFQGLQQNFEFDDFGDSQRDLFMTVVENGNFVITKT